jgi:hypothetical protein
VFLWFVQAVFRRGEKKHAGQAAGSGRAASQRPSTFRQGAHPNRLVDWLARRGCFALLVVSVVDSPAGAARPYKIDPSTHYRRR